MPGAAPMLLTPAELRELTNHRRSDAQARALDHIGMPYARRADGTLMVLRAVAERLLGGAGTIERPEPQVQP